MLLLKLNNQGQVNPIDASQLYRMLVFASVVEQGSLTAAATQLGISRSMVSQHLKRLESRCQQTLLRRTTYRLSLTQTGQEFYYYCAELLLLAKQAAASLLSTAIHQRALVPRLTDYNTIPFTPYRVITTPYHLRLG